MRYQIAIQMSQDKLINYKYISYMGAALSAVEIITMGLSIESEVQVHVLEGQIQNLWDQHKDIITNVAKLYQLIEKMSFQDSLFSQINVSQSFSVQNWGMIAKEISEQSKIVDDVKNNFDKILQNQISHSSYLGLGLSLFGFTLSSFMMWKIVAPQQYQILKKNIAKAGSTVYQKVRTAVRKVLRSNINQEGLIQHQYIQGDVFARQPSTPQARNPNSKGWLNEISFMNFARLLFLGFMIYSYINGRIHISSLREHLIQAQQYFGDKGQFQKQVQNCVNACKIFACDVVNLAHASRAVIEDLHAIYLTKAAIENYQKSRYIQRANQLTTKLYGLTDDFITKCDLFSQKMSETSNSKNLSNHEKIEHFLEHFNDFYKTNAGQKQPDKIFLSVTTQVSSVVGQDSILTNEVYRKQEDIFYTAKDISKSFKRHRRGYDEMDNEEKVKADQAILKQCEQSYKTNVLEEENTNLRPHEKEEMAGIMLNFCNEFRGTDPTGAKLYDIIIKDYKGKSTYGDLIDHMDHISESQNIPIFIDDKAKEKIEVDKMFKVAKDFALKELAKGNDKFVDVAETTQAPSNCSRYLNLVKVPTGTEQKGLPKLQLLGSNLMMFKVRGKLYTVQQAIISGKITMIKG